MKSVAELGILAGVAVVAGLGNWLAAGKPSADPVLELQQVPLKEGEILLTDVLKDGSEGLVWVDARPDSNWRENGLEGSLNITMQSEQALIDQVAMHSGDLLEAKRIVVYCSDVHCSVSHDLAAKLKGELKDFIGGEVKVLYGGVVALEAAGLIRSSSPAP